MSWLLEGVLRCARRAGRSPKREGKPEGEFYGKFRGLVRVGIVNGKQVNTLSNLAAVSEAEVTLAICQDIAENKSILWCDVPSSGCHGLVHRTETVEPLRVDIKEDFASRPDPEVGSKIVIRASTQFSPGIRHTVTNKTAARIQVDTGGPVMIVVYL